METKDTHPALAWAVIVLHAALLIVAVPLIFIPETRTPLVRGAFWVLQVAILVRLWRAGLLSKSLPQINADFQARPAGLLEFVAMSAGAIAGVVLMVVDFRATWGAG